MYLSFRCEPMMALRAMSARIVTCLLITAVTCGKPLFANDQIDRSVQDIVVDLQSWQLDKIESANGLAHLKTVQIVIDCLAINGFIDNAEHVATKLNHKDRFYSAALPVLLREGEFRRAEQMTESLSRSNPRLRVYHEFDVFVARATQNDLEDGFAYLESRYGNRNNVPSRHLNFALAKVAKFYRQADDDVAEANALKLISNDRDMQIARAIVASKSELDLPIDIERISPLFLRLMHESESPDAIHRREEIWYAARVELFNAMLSGNMARVNELKTTMSRIPKYSDAQADRSFKIALDALIAKHSGDVALVKSNMDELHEQFGGSVFFSNKRFDRNWIAYVMACTGKWGLKELNAYWQRWDKDRPYDWVIGFAAGYQEFGKGDLLQKLIANTERTDARCFLKAGRLIGELSRTSSANVAQEPSFNVNAHIISR